MWAPFLMCLVLTGIHAYLGIHVIAREVVFVDIALAQIAALGAAAAFLVGFEPEHVGSYWFGLAATMLGALVLALTRSRSATCPRRRSSASCTRCLGGRRAAGRSLPHGAEYLRTMLVGSILAVQWPDVVKVAAFTRPSAFPLVCRRPFFLISFDPAAAYREGWRVRSGISSSTPRSGSLWLARSASPGCFWCSPTSSCRPWPGIVVGGPVSTRLLVGWAFGTGVSVLGLLASACWICPPAPRWPACSAWFCFSGPASCGSAVSGGPPESRSFTPVSRL